MTIFEAHLRLLTGSILQTMEGFLDSSNSALPYTNTSPLALEQVRRDLEDLQMSTARTQNASLDWVTEYQPQEGGLLPMDPASAPGKTQGFTFADFASFQLSRGRVERAQSLNSTITGPTNRYRSSWSVGYGPDVLFAGSQPGWAARRYLPYSQRMPTTTESKGKGRISELDEEKWEAQFAQIETQGLTRMDAEATAKTEKQLGDIDRSVSFRAASMVIGE